MMLPLRRVSSFRIDTSGKMEATQLGLDLAGEGEAPNAQLKAAGDFQPILLANAEVPAFAREHLGRELRIFYDAVLAEAQPPQLLRLIGRLGDVLTARDAEASAAFRSDLVAALPGLRAFALSLAVDAHRADDLVQEAVLKAWANQRRFERGTNIMAWLCTILRNQFYTEIRKTRREVEDVDGAHAGQMIAPPNQEHTVALERVAFHLRKLPATQREALVLVGAQGMTYEAAAAVLGCQVGTVKSRVSRCRTALAEALGLTESLKPA